MFGNFQTKELLVIRLVCPNTIDEVVEMRARNKKLLAKSIVDDGRIVEGEIKFSTKGKKILLFELLV